MSPTNHTLMRAVVPRALRARGTLPRSFPRHDQMTNAHRAAASAGMTLPFGVKFDANAIRQDE